MEGRMDLKAPKFTTEGLPEEILILSQLSLNRRLNQTLTERQIN